MAFNGTGTFVRLYNWVTDKNNSVPITASKMDDETDGIATGLTNCITKDGQTVITQNIPFNSKKITGLAVGTARTDAINVGQVQDSQFTYLGTTGGAADAYTATPSPAITAYAANQRFTAKIIATNLTTTPYLQISAIGTPASDAVIKKLSATKTEIAVEIGDMLINGLYEWQRNSANTAWILLNPEKEVKISASTVSAGALTIASQGTLTIASGAITVTGSNHLVDTESAAATDNLDTISGTVAGQIVTIGSVADARDIVITNSGNIRTNDGLSLTLNYSNDKVSFLSDGTNLFQISRSLKDDARRVAKAWVSFNGKSANPITAGSSFNISGTITKNSTGNYTVTFTTPFSSANYCVVVSSKQTSSSAAALVQEVSKLAGSYRFLTTDTSVGASDAGAIDILFFGDQ
jgi:hypothetical protein